MDERLDPEVFWPRLRRALDRVSDEQRTPPPEARVGAVLVLLEDTPQGPRLVLTRRRRDLRSHPGQVSFAGGRLDPGETIEGAALREAAEEIGLDGASIEVLGVGPTFYIPPSRFWVAPVVARWHAPHELTLNPWEVDEVLHVPIATLLERDRWRQVPLTLRGASWAWQLDDDLLWGATAMVTALLLEVAVEGWSGGLRPEDLGDEHTVRPWEHAPSWQRPARLAGELPEVVQDELPHATGEQLRSVYDRLAELGIGHDELAEQAGRAVAHAVRRLLGDVSLAAVPVTVLVGPGGNGIDGLTAARLLAAAGAHVTVVCTGDVARPPHGELLRHVGVRVLDARDDDVLRGLDPGRVLVDAMLGIGAEPPLRDVPERCAAWLRRHDVRVVALDLPSGVHPTDGLHGPCVTADVTVAFGLPTVALRERIVHPYMGDLYLADLGIPPQVWRDVGCEPVVFDRGPLVRLVSGERAPDAGTPDQAVRPAG